MAFWKRRPQPDGATASHPSPKPTVSPAGQPGSGGAPGRGPGGEPDAAQIAGDLTAARRSPSSGKGGSSEGGAADEQSSSFLRGDAGEDTRSLDVLLDTIARVSLSRDLESLLDYVVDSSIQATGAERGFLVLYDDEAEAQVVRVARELNPQRDSKRGGAERGTVPVGRDVKYSTSVVQRVIEEQKPLRTTVQKNADDLSLGNSVYDLKLRAVMCVPLVPRGGAAGQPDGAPEMPRGALYVDSKAASRAFQPEDLALFYALAQHIAIALENAQLNLHSIERARLEKSLEIAAEIQAGLMPKSPPSMEGYDLYGWYRSAEHASGDFFDFVRTKSGGVAAVVGDVTGHGVGPALVTATAQASLRSYARVLEDPGSVVTMLNADLSERMDDGMFLTLFIAELDQDGRVQVLNAGHTPPLIWRAATKTIESISSDGPALGLMDDLVYETGDDLHLEVGDVLLAFSDGLVEARHPDHPERFFEEQGVRAVLSDRGHAGATAREIVESVAQAALEFAEGAREDDVTIVAIRRK